MKKIKVLHLTSSRGKIGGAQNLLLALGNKYDREHFEWFFCNLFDDARGKGPFPTALKEKGFGIAIIEAMAMRKPVVASRVGGIPEVVEAGVTGLLVQPENPDALAMGILQYLSDPLLAKHAGERGRERVEKLFTIERMVENYQAVYRGCQRIS